MEEKDKPAFPISEEETDRLDAGIKIYTGITIRDYFAAKAMQGFCSRNGEFYAMEIAKTAYFLADEMLKEREDNNGK